VFSEHSLYNSLKVSDLRRNFGVEGGPDADIAFYFDTLHLALSAVSSMKEAGTWPTIGGLHVL
jgi:hypothetical protein